MADPIKLNDQEYDPENLPFELDFTLRKTISVGDFKLDTIKLMEPNAGEYEIYSQMAKINGSGAMIKLITMVAQRADKNVSPPMIKAMGVKDLMEVSAYYFAFM